MKKFLKLTAAAAAVITAFSMNICAFGEPAQTTAAEGGAETAEPAPPALTSGAFFSSYSLSSDSTILKENDTAYLTVTTFIPISNFTSDVTTAYFDTSNIFAAAKTNESFDPLTPYSWEDKFYIAGNFLCVESTFIDVKYLGKGNTFEYSIYYSSDSSGTNVPLSFSVVECVETPAEENSVPSFTLADREVYTIKAGEKKSLNFTLRTIGQGKASAVSASLSSQSNDVIVEDTGEKTGYHIPPSFNFEVSVPKSTPAGIYNLTLSVRIYDINGNPGGDYSYTIPLKVESDVKASALTLKDYEISKDTVSSGDSFKLTLTLENKCGIDLENIEVSLPALDSSKFVLDGGFSKQTVSIKNGKTGKVSFPLVACGGISAVRESIGVQAAYSINPNNPETSKTLDTSVIITCKPKSESQEMGKFDLVMTDYKIDKSVVEEKTRFNLTVTLENTSKNKIENARLSVMGLDGTKFAINSGLTYKDFDIGAGKTKSFTFEVVGCAGISSIREVIPILIEYGTVSSEASVTVTCKPDESKTEEGKDDVFAPNIIIESYDFGSEFVTAGQTFNLKAIVKNTASNAVIENLKITVNGASSSTDGSIAYSPANSSNSFFFEKLGAKSTAELSLDLLAKVDAVPNSYPIEISFNYEYSAGGKRYQAQPVVETITIPLQQEDRLTINQPEYPNYTVNVGDMCNISTSLVNKGKSGVYNVSASVEGEGFDVSQGVYYIGNINSGSEEYYDAQITPTTEGEIKGEIVITYEDANGTEKEQRKPFSFTAAQFNYDTMYPDGGMEIGGGDMGVDSGMAIPEEEGKFPLIPVIIIAAVVIAAVIVTIIIVKKRKRKKELEDDDEDI